MRNIKTFEDVRLELVELRGAIDSWRTRSQDLHGLRITNAGDAIHDQDYITKGQVDEIIKGVVPNTLPKIISAITNNIINNLGGGNWIHYQIDLTGPLTLPDSPEAMPGTFIEIIAFQDATGGRILTWPAKYFGMSGYTATTNPGSYQVALFFCVDPATEFRLLAPPISGVA